MGWLDQLGVANWQVPDALAGGWLRPKEVGEEVLLLRARPAFRRIRGEHRHGEPSGGEAGDQRQVSSDLEREDLIGIGNSLCGKGAEGESGEVRRRDSDSGAK